MDGQTEVVNNSLVNLLRSLSGENPIHWDLALAQVEFTYNDLVNRSMGNIPFQIFLWMVAKRCGRFGCIFRFGRQEEC
jgi:hypothetical protein